MSLNVGDIVWVRVHDPPPNDENAKDRTALVWRTQSNCSTCWVACISTTPSDEDDKRAHYEIALPVGENGNRHPVTGLKLAPGKDKTVLKLWWFEEVPVADCEPHRIDNRRARLPPTLLAAVVQKQGEWTQTDAYRELKSIRKI